MHSYHWFSRTSRLIPALCLLLSVQQAAAQNSASTAASIRSIVPITLHDGPIILGIDTFGVHQNATYCTDGQLDPDLEGELTGSRQANAAGARDVEEGFEVEVEIDREIERWQGMGEVELSEQSVTIRLVAYDVSHAEGSDHQVDEPLLEGFGAGESRPTGGGDQFFTIAKAGIVGGIIPLECDRDRDVAGFEADFQIEACIGSEPVAYGDLVLDSSRSDELEASVVSFRLLSCSQAQHVLQR